MTSLIFSHANSFPASTYAKLFSLLDADFSIQAIEKYGHDPRYPVSNNWPHLVEELLALLHTTSAHKGQEKSLLVGHSLGGYLSLFAAHKAPHLVQGVVLLDSPILVGWRASLVRLAKISPLGDYLSPARFSKKRRDSWDSQDAAYAHFVSKHLFARWDKDMLHDYAKHGTYQAQGKRLLAFSRDVETQIYRGIADNLGSLMAQPFPVPVAFIGGSMSQEVKQVGMKATLKATQGRVSWVAGSHLFPMENPKETAKAIGFFTKQFASEAALDKTV